MTKSEKFNDYDGFIAKFKPRKTTDDCYTPPEIYEAVKGWACKQYGIDPASVVRPFWPGGDYEAFDYPAGCVVLDNPPFSCLAKIVRFYEARSIPYFLFAPGLTCLGLTRSGAGVIYTDKRITYQNGAKINTAFATSFGDNIVEIAPSLGEAIRAVQHNKSRAPQLTYQYPPNLLTTQGALSLARNNIPFAVRRDNAIFVRALDEMRTEGKEAFGGALLITDADARRKSDAEKDIPHPPATKIWHLSDRERGIINILNSKRPADYLGQQGVF